MVSSIRTLHYVVQYKHIALWWLEYLHCIMVSSMHKIALWCPVYIHCIILSSIYKIALWYPVHTLDIVMSRDTLANGVQYARWNYGVQ